MIFSLTNIIDLFQVISENAPDAIKTGEIKNHFGRKVAIVCQKLIAPFSSMFQLSVAQWLMVRYLQDACVIDLGPRSYLH